MNTKSTKVGSNATLRKALEKQAKADLAEAKSTKGRSFIIPKGSLIGELINGEEYINTPSLKDIQNAGMGKSFPKIDIDTDNPVFTLMDKNEGVETPRKVRRKAVNFNRKFVRYLKEEVMENGIVELELAQDVKATETTKVKTYNGEPTTFINVWIQ